jgi:hypothetical protein
MIRWQTENEKGNRRLTVFYLQMNKKASEPLSLGRELDRWQCGRRVRGRSLKKAGNAMDGLSLFKAPDPVMMLDRTCPQAQSGSRTGLPTDFVTLGVRLCFPGISARDGGERRRRVLVRDGGADPRVDGRPRALPPPPPPAPRGPRRQLLQGPPPPLLLSHTFFFFCVSRLDIVARSSVDLLGFGSCRIGCGKWWTRSGWSASAGNPWRACSCCRPDASMYGLGSTPVSLT